MERRMIDLGSVEVQDGTETAPPRFRGKAIAYNSRTEIGNPAKYGFFEEIDPGAALRSLADDDQVLLVNHDPAMIVARRSAGTLQLRSEADGLYVEADLPEDLSYARDLRANLRNGNIKGMSFGFNVPDGGRAVSDVEGGTLVRVTELQLMEVSAVTFPAYEATDASLRFSPMLAERRDKWVEPPPEALRDRLVYRARYLALRHGLKFSHEEKKINQRENNAKEEC